MGLDLILYWKTCNYWKVTFLSLKCLYVPDDLLFCYQKRQYYSRSIYKSLVYSKQNAVVLRFEIVRDIKIFITPVSTTLILLLFFQIIKIRQCCSFTFTIFFLFLTATNALAASWVSWTFSNTRIFFVFFLFQSF